MFTISTPKDGLLAFEERNVIPFDVTITGSTFHEATTSAAHIKYQELNQESYSIRHSCYDIKDDLTLHINRKEPWLGFRLIRKKGILHHSGEKEIKMLQGQLNFAYCTTLDNCIELEKGNVYDVLDLYISPAMLYKIAEGDKLLADFAERIQMGKDAALAEKPFWGNIKVLDTIDYLMRNPNNKIAVEETLRQIAEAAAAPKPNIQYITEQHIENIFLVRDEIRNNLTVHTEIEELAKKAQMNVTYFKQMFYGIFELSPYQYLLYERMKMAKELLRNDPSLSFTNVAALVGFSSYDNFQRAFSKKEGKSLTDWRNANDLAAFILSWEMLSA
ncbi:MAG: AraC family transcriptional regulator [Chryseobacterium sp.]|nr:MAG: AraC family transcriptional regulator [Chryseobacterium sp.]